MRITTGIIVSLLMTGLVGVGMLLIGGSALLNNNTVPVSNAPQTAGTQGISAQPSQMDTQQLESLVQQYQQREKQYQAQLNTAAQRLKEANQQVKSYQQVLEALQQQGIIRISDDGQVMIPRARGDSNRSFFDNDDH